MTIREEILQQAKICVCTDREAAYGAPENNFARIANLWNAYKPGNFAPHDVAIMLALLKIGRIASGKVKADNYIDLAGYAACAAELALNEKPTVDELVSAIRNLEGRIVDCEYCKRPEKNSSNTPDPDTN